MLSPGRRCRRWNYLRVRGEYQKDTERKTIMQELPPRARRIRWGDRVDFPLFGTTSACAENTGCNPCTPSCHRNYLRVRGEYYAEPWPNLSWGELPPRARRIRFGRCGVNNIHGTTSACAENTGCNPCTPSCHRNYLRVRGEYYAEPWPNLSWGELPPRARRILFVDTSRV